MKISSKRIIIVSIPMIHLLFSWMKDWTSCHIDWLLKIYFPTRTTSLQARIWNRYSEYSQPCCSFRSIFNPSLSFSFIDLPGVVLSVSWMFAWYSFNFYKCPFVGHERFLANIPSLVSGSWFWHITDISKWSQLLTDEEKVRGNEREWLVMQESRSSRTVKSPAWQRICQAAWKKEWVVSHMRKDYRMASHYDLWFSCLQCKNSLIRSRYFSISANEW